MLIVTKRRYKKKYVIGGAGIFDSVTNFLKRLAVSNDAKAFASKLASAAKTDLGKKAIDVGKTAAKEIGKHAIDVGKDVAVAKAKALIENAVARKAQMAAPVPLTEKSKAILESLIGPSPLRINPGLLTGSGVSQTRNRRTKHPKTQNWPSTAINIQEFVKQKNSGAGLYLT